MKNQWEKKQRFENRRNVQYEKWWSPKTNTTILNNEEIKLIAQTSGTWPLLRGKYINVQITMSKVAILFELLRSNVWKFCLVDASPEDRIVEKPTWLRSSLEAALVPGKSVCISSSAPPSSESTEPSGKRRGRPNNWVVSFLQIKKYKSTVNKCSYCSHKINIPRESAFSKIMMNNQ